MRSPEGQERQDLETGRVDMEGVPLVTQPLITHTAPPLRLLQTRHKQYYVRRCIYVCISSLVAASLCIYARRFGPLGWPNIGHTRGVGDAGTVVLVVGKTGRTGTLVYTSTSKAPVVLFLTY